MKAPVRFLLAYIGPSQAITAHLSPVAAYRRDPAAFRALYEAMRLVMVREEGQRRLFE